MASVSYVRVYADATGESHFADERMPLTLVEAGAPVPVPASAPYAATETRFFCFPPDTRVDWHPAPRRQFYVLLSGGVELEVTDGEVRRFGVGRLILGEATEGRGVRAHWLEGAPGCVAVVPLADM